MTDDVAELRKLLEAATPGPWFTLDPPWLPGGAETSILAESPDPHVARFICDFDLCMMDDDDRKSENPDADAALIVAAVNALPDLLDRLEKAEQALREIRDCRGVTIEHEVSQMRKRARAYFTDKQES
tara:strand:+ start:2835 stop:3218 length:384 start_codon:yes stop_codon:yes gene_type:complete